MAYVAYDLLAGSGAINYDVLQEEDSIRLLLLDPPSIDKPSEVTGRLIHTTLTQCEHEIIEPYTALSYVWGDPANSKIIKIDEFPINVTLNLYHALHDIRDQTRIQKLWADAICINQRDDAEKAKQIQLMGRIYSIAGSTLIYLGTPTPDIPSNHLLGPIDYTALDEKRVDKLLEARWFRRSWVFQEVVLSRDPRVQYGRWRCTWDEMVKFASQSIDTRNENSLEKVWKRYTSEQSALKRLSSGRSIILEMQKVKARHSNFKLSFDGNPNPILQLVNTRRGFESTDPKDMIFAYTGVASDGNQVSLDVDYTKPCAQVYEDFARCQLKHAKNYDIFACISEGSQTFQGHTLPSWVRKLPI
jgi:hypothetical protein